MLVAAKTFSFIKYDILCLLLQKIDISSLLQKLLERVVLKQIDVLKKFGKHGELFFWQGEKHFLMRNARIF